MGYGVWSRHGRGHDGVVTRPTNPYKRIFLSIGRGREGLKLHSKTETVDRHFHYRSFFSVQRIKGIYSSEWGTNSFVNNSHFDIQ